MQEREIYLDNNATTKPLPEVRDEVCRMLGEEFGNPSSAHGAGERARTHLAAARGRVARLIGAPPSNVTFLSSGTESNNMAFYSCTRNKGKKCRVVTTTIEHSSIRKMCSYLCINDVEIRFVKVDGKGIVDLASLEKNINDDTTLVSVQWVSNETGVIQPVEEIGEMCRRYGVPFHTDAAQAVGKIDMTVRDMPIDFLSFTGHKFHGPQGAAAIYSRDRFMLAPIFFGGFQEEGFRPGTENLPGIAGFGKAAEIRKANLERDIAYMRELRDGFEARILDFIPGTSVNGDTHSRISNTTNILFKGIDGRRLIAELDAAGLRCSQSSACTNFEVAPSHILSAMGLTEEEAYSSVRFSFSVENTLEEASKAVEIIRESCERLSS
ncbi:MAG TPA: cysteine desulfurase family protein [Thermodesulfobacteriota bacterium]|nr:cysteine desulfurase family protein [Thermodesulfobacteriota bacterium]